MINKIINGTKYRLNIYAGRINRYFYKAPQVLNSLDTLDLIINEKRSMCRFGDGEFKLIFGKRIGFQNIDKELSVQLKAILSDSKTKCLIGIPIMLSELKGIQKDVANW